MQLDKDFIETVIPLTSDFEGNNIATLVTSKNNTNARPAVLYIHGFIDYFFHPHVAEAFHENDMDFYALDLRKYGRSLLPHQTPNYCENIEEYFEELTMAITEIQSNTNKPIYLLAHSTGCTIVGMYMNQGNKKDDISGVIFNSPFLEMTQSNFMKNALYKFGVFITKFYRKATIPSSKTAVYSKTIHKDFSGEWNFDLNKKPIEGFDVYFNWAIAVVDAQQFLQKKSNIVVPILVLHSDKSNTPKEINQLAMNSDIVLNIKDMMKYGKTLGKQVSLVSIKDGMHDLFLSKETVRKEAMSEMFLWLKKYH